jgi:6,7-dimethyl-8-ribityllumazine synthase
MGQSYHIGIVASDYNREYVEGLVKAARQSLEGHQISQTTVPGAFEIPLAVQSQLKQPSLDAVLALGVIWQGKTAHADLIATEVTRALMNLMLEYEKPVLHGVLTVRTEKQARARCLGKKLNRGTECAEACLKMLNLNTK